MHYPIWAAWGRHYRRFRAGYWVHNAEHGGVILLAHRCPEGCPDVVDSLLEVARSLPADRSCQAPVREPRDRRGGSAAAARGAGGRGGLEQLVRGGLRSIRYARTFAAARYNKGPEDLCADGASLERHGDRAGAVGGSREAAAGWRVRRQRCWRVRRRPSGLNAPRQA